MDSKYTIGIDLGGTKFHVALVDSAYRIYGETFRGPTHDAKDAGELLKRMTDAVRKTVEINGLDMMAVRAVGVGSPGPLDPFKGRILETLNLKVFQNFELKKEMEAALSLPVFVDNDANCFGLGEQKGGVARGLKHVIAVTLGTGYGFSIILNGQVLHGANGLATEIALTPYRGKGYEDYISGRGLAMVHHELHGELLEGPEISKRAFEGDGLARESFSVWGEHLGNTLIPYFTALDPDMLVVGGSIAANWDFFHESLDRQVRGLLFEPARSRVQIRKSELGEKATMIGAAALADTDLVI